MNTPSRNITTVRAYVTARWRMRRPCPAGWQAHQVQAHLERILPASPWYRRKFARLDPRDWAQFPTIDKAEMMENFDALNTVGIRKQEAMEIALRGERTRDFSPQIDDITIGLSSGTSGNAGLFLASPRERAEWAGNVLAKILPRSLLHAQRIALFLRANSRLYEATRSRRVQFEFFDLLEPLDAHVERLNRLRPDLVVAPPSMWLLLAGQRRRGALSIRPRKIVSAAEALDALDARTIEGAFDQRLHEVYQCTEGFLAATCGYGTLHVNEDLVVMQKDYLDRESGRFVPIITDFRRTSQPIIRYRLDDILVERHGAQCPCGSPWMALDQIEGRCDDLCFLPSRDETGTWIPLFPDFLRRAVIGADERIMEFAVRQPDERTLQVSFVSRNGSESEDLEARIVKALRQRADSLGGVEPTVIFTPMPERSPLAKRRRIRRDCPLPRSLR